MNWDAVGSSAELVGAIAVVFSLAYVALQLRTSMLATRSAVRQASADRLITTMSLQLDSAVLANSRAKQIEQKPLDTIDQHQVQLYSAIWWRTYESIHYQYRTGLFDEDEWRSHAGVIGRVFTLDESFLMDDHKAFWEARSASFSPLFQEAVQEIRSNVGIQ